MAKIAHTRTVVMHFRSISFYLTGIKSTFSDINCLVLSEQKILYRIRPELQTMKIIIQKTKDCP